MSKTFGEIKKGDKIYYYSHGKIRTRVVTDVCDCKPKWSDRLRPCIVFKRGRPIDIEYDCVRCSCKYGEYFVIIVGQILRGHCVLAAGDDLRFSL